MRDVGTLALGTQTQCGPWDLVVRACVPGSAVAGPMSRCREDCEICRLGVRSQYIDCGKRGEDPNGKQHFIGISELKEEYEWS